MDIIDSIILGIIQGLTEFLPVSSSGHLELGKAILGDESIPVSLDYCFQEDPNDVIHDAYEKIILDLNSGEYFGTGSVGGFIWDQLAEPQPLSGIATAITAKFDIDQQQAGTDLLEFVSQLIERGLASVAESG